MKALLLAIPLLLAAGCSGSSNDDQYATKAPPPGPNATAVKPMADKPTAASLRHLSIPGGAPGGRK